METAETAELIPAEYQPHFKAHATLVAQAKQLAIITDDASYEKAKEFRITIDRQKKTWASVIKPAVQAAYQAHQRIKGVENLVADPLGQALTVIDPAISRWRIEQETKRRLEQERINRELKAREEDSRLEEAEELERSGKSDEAEEMLNAPIIAPEVVLPSKTHNDGLQDRTYWSAEVFDIVKLCRAVADGKAAPECVRANEILFNGMARAMKGAMNAEWESKGVRAVSRSGLVGGR